MIDAHVSDDSISILRLGFDTAPLHLPLEVVWSRIFVLSLGTKRANVPWGLVH